jgi:hypothetical protein
MMVIYYPRGAGGVGVPKAGLPRHVIELRGQPVGYGDAYRRGTRWNLRLSLSPELWGSEIERQAIQLLTRAVASTIGEGAATNATNATTFALHVPSAAHVAVARVGHGGAAL